jgi:hypothetical protein
MRVVVKRLVAWTGAVATLVGGAGCSRGTNEAPAPSGDASPAAASPSASGAPSSSAVAATDVDASDRSPIPKELVEAVLNPQHLPVYTGPTGSVEGTILVIGPPAPDVKIDTKQCPAALDTYGKLFREGTPAAPNGPRPLGDTVVIAVGYAGYYIPEHEQVKSVTITPNCAYPARTITMTFGQRLEISNQSKFPFAPTIANETSPAIMMAAPLGMGDPIRLYPSRPGHQDMRDIMQPYVDQDLYVLRYPLHTVTDVYGHYRIDGVPVGKMNVRALHPTVASEAQHPVDIVANVVAKLDLTLEYAPKARGDAGAHELILR